MKEILLDTHIILWAFESSNSLLQSVREMILEKENAIYYSVVSTWEVAIKHMEIKKVNVL